MRLNLKTKLVLILFLIVLFPAGIYLSVYYIDIVYNKNQAKNELIKFHAEKESVIVQKEIYDGLEIIKNIHENYRLEANGIAHLKKLENELDVEFALQRGDVFLLGSLSQKLDDSFGSYDGKIYFKDTLGQETLYMIYEMPLYFSSMDVQHFVYKNDELISDFGGNLFVAKMFSGFEEDKAFFFAGEKYEVMKSDDNGLAFVTLAKIERNPTILDERVISGVKKVSLYTMMLLLPLYALAYAMVLPILSFKKDVDENAVTGKHDPIKEWGYREVYELRCEYNELLLELANAEKDEKVSTEKLKGINGELKRKNRELRDVLDKHIILREGIAEKREKALEILNLFDEIIITTNSKGNAIYGNNGAKLLLGKDFIENEEPISEALLEHLITTEKGRKDIRRLIEKSGKERAVVRFKNPKSRKSSVYDIRKMPYGDKQYSSSIIIGEDITHMFHERKSTLKRNKMLDTINTIDYELLRESNTSAFLEKVISYIKENISPVFVKAVSVEESILSVTGTPWKTELDVKLSSLLKELKSAYKTKNKRELQSKKVLYQEYSYRDISELHILPLTSGENRYYLIIGLDENSQADQRYMELIMKHLGSALEKNFLDQKDKENFFMMLEGFTAAIEANDTYTKGHSKRVAYLSWLIGKQMGLGGKELDKLYYSGLLHDVGKISISEGILNKKGYLTDEEFESIKQHPCLGHSALANVDLDEDVLQGILLHHKRHDLRGYPADVIIDELPLFPSIIGVADAMDAMLSKRSYNTTKDIEEVVNELVKNSGTQFTPSIVNIVLGIYNSNNRQLLVAEKVGVDYELLGSL